MEMKPREEEGVKVVKCKGLWRGDQGICLRENLYVCPHCGRYGRLLARTRIRQVADKDSFTELYGDRRLRTRSIFRAMRISAAELAEKVGMLDAVKTGVCRIGGVETCIGVMDSHFMMASMGSVVGES